MQKPAKLYSISALIFFQFLFFSTPTDSISDHMEVNQRELVSELRQIDHSITESIDAEQGIYLYQQDANSKFHYYLINIFLMVIVLLTITLILLKTLYRYRFYSIVIVLTITFMSHMTFAQPKTGSEIANDTYYEQMSGPGGPIVSQNNNGPPDPGPEIPTDQHIIALMLMGVGVGIYGIYRKLKNNQVVASD